MKVWAVFHGYSGSYMSNGHTRKFADDEWLCDLYSAESLAREAVLKFGEGKSFDSNLENQITRYYKPGKTVFDKGEEVESVLGDYPASYTGYREWMRYTPITVLEPEEQDTYIF